MSSFFFGRSNNVSIINGKVYKGDVTIVNGKVISGEVCDLESNNVVKFDETKREKSYGIKKITISSSSKVKVIGYDGEEIIASLKGYSSGNVSFDMTRQSDKIVINNNTNGVTNIIVANSVGVMSSVTMGNERAGLVLEVKIPNHEFAELSIKTCSEDIVVSNISKVNCLNVESVSGDIDISDSVKVYGITAFLKSGDIKCLASFQKLGIDTTSGDVEINSKAYSSIVINIETSSGDIDVKVRNVKDYQVRAQTISGDFIQRAKLIGMYTVCGHITSISGDIKLH